MFWKRPTRTVTVQIEANVEWKVAQDPDSGEWIGVCPTLNLNAVGDTFADLQRCAEDAMQLLFSELFKEGQLGTFLREHNWTVQALPERGTTPRFDTPYVTRRTPVRELMPA